MQVALICKSRLYENILEISNKALTKSSFFFNQLICKSLNYMQKSVIWKKTIQRFGIKVALMYPKKSFHEFPSKSFLAIRGARSRPSSKKRAIDRARKEWKGFKVFVESHYSKLPDAKSLWKSVMSSLPEIMAKMAVTYANSVINSVQIFYGIV